MDTKNYDSAQIHQYSEIMQVSDTSIITIPQ